MARETGRSGYKVKLKAKLKKRFPGCIIQDQDPNVLHQGIPDILVLWNGSWGMLETKAARGSAKQPNQGHWVEFYNQQSFAAFIYPANEEEVLNALEQSLTSCGVAFNPQP